MFDYLLQNALIAGIDIEKYWDLTLFEITTIIKAYNKREENKYKSQLQMNYELAANISTFVNMQMAGKAIPSFEKLYPSLVEVSPEQHKKRVEFYKEQFRAFSEHHNSIRNKEVTHNG